MSCWHTSLPCNSIVSLTLQNTLTKTPVRHFPITYEAVTNTFMLDTNHRNTPQPFSRPYTSINLRYATTCKSQDGVVIRVTWWMCFNDNNRMFSYDKNNVQTGTQLSFNTKNMHRFGDAELMSLTLFLNTFGSSTRVKWGISNIEVAHNNNNDNNTDNNTNTSCSY